jgi:hypothetical protein
MAPKHSATILFGYAAVFLVHAVDGRLVCVFCIYCVAMSMHDIKHRVLSSVGPSKRGSRFG